MVFVYGAIVGSFLNVVIYRFNTNFTIGGRSKCLSCGGTLAWYDLIPIVSYLILGGKCRGCKSGISIQYPIVEASTGVIFVFLFKYLTAMQSTFLPFLVHSTLLLMIVSVLIVIAVYDIRHKIIPDSLVYSFAVMALALLFLGDNTLFVWPGLGSILAGPFLAAPFAALWLFSSGRLIGFGDAKLALGIGFLLGLSQGIAAAILSFWAGAIVGLVMLAVSKRKVTFKTEVPFAPFMILGTLVALLWQIDIFTIAGWFMM